ncbi:N-acetyltransferase [Anaerotignum lactatifermentans]|uniref:N-acetyltransferase n=1 Tax=Anaerotignum lactatifermentans TaxID=160404 RepID=A0ABS2GCI6_9FIRM|nr:GNAT family N-acetyltransferase [Anaerotignum lactatifermentans]MBM6829851.1 N-acetyltransferase [Anaerotignum lactatifermentans]MBM6878209.1 N-acetyltransferase [Anaerotignum lactatifermentans]MBM6951289.1 N-acetyltransferase [Anaerotignum lactatifermentans]
MGKMRMATVADTKEILEIYSQYIRNTTVTFEYVVPSEADFAGRIREILEKYPYLVYEEQGKITGYAYAHQFMVRAASQWGAELSVYLAPQAQKRGLGKAFYRALEELLFLQNVEKLYGCIEASNEASRRLHEVMGYEKTALFPRCAYKKGQWLSLLWLEKTLIERAEPLPLKTIWQVPEEKRKEILEVYTQCVRS